MLDEDFTLRWLYISRENLQYNDEQTYFLNLRSKWLTNKRWVQTSFKDACEFAKQKWISKLRSQIYAKMHEIKVKF